MVSKVLIYKSSLLPYSETFILEQARALGAWQAVLVGESRSENGLSLEGIDTLFLSPRNALLRKIHRQFFRLLGRPCPYAIKVLQKERADLVHVHFGMEAIQVWPLVRELNLPMLVTLHGFDINTYKEWWQEGNGGWWWKRYPERLLNLARQESVHFIAVSEAIKNRAIEYGIPEDKITVNYIGVDTEKFRPSNNPLGERKEVLFIGRLVEKKGCHYLIKSFIDVQEDHPDAELVIVGSGPEEEKLKLLVKKHNVRAKFLGALNSEQIKERINSSRVVCLPSVVAENGDAEGLGLVLLEAQACGVPVITSARGGATEAMLHNETGFSHIEKDVPSISMALRKLLADDALVESFGQAARMFVLEKMELFMCTKKLEKIYDDVAYKAHE